MTGMGIFDQLGDFGSGRCVQTRRRFVVQHHAGIECKGPGNGQSLSLPTAQRRRPHAGRYAKFVQQAPRVQHLATLTPLPRR